MLDILNAFRKKYYLNIGRNQSSPVMEFSAGLILQYADRLIDAPYAEQKPFYLCVPSKENFSAHFVCTLLLHYLFEDYCNPAMVPLSPGDKIEIFGSVAKYAGLVTEQKIQRIRLLFANETTYNAPESYRQHMAIADSRRRLDTIDVFKKRRKNYSKNNELNSLLNLGSDETVNPNGLKSKVYLVSGRGRLTTMREKLKNANCISQSLEKVFRVGTNLIIAPDLEEFIPILNASADSDSSYFVDELTADLAELREIYYGEAQVIDLIDDLVSHIVESDFSEVFRRLFNRLVESVEDFERVRLLGLAEYIPQKKGGLPDDLRMIVLDGIHLATIYSNTIARLVACGVPVIILTDQAELVSFSDWETEVRKSNYRFYWSRCRIMELVDTCSVEYCDGQFWEKCKRYASQKVIIRSYSDPVGDRLFNTFESNLAFAQLDGFELLKKAYYESLRPALYLLKNTPESHPEVIKAVREQVQIFSSAFEIVERHLPEDIALPISQRLAEFRSYNTNVKRLPADQPVFIQQIHFSQWPKQHTAYSTPKKLQILDLDKLESSSVVFTGYPYREWNGKYLSDAVFSQLIPRITVLAWRLEARRTMAYLLRRILKAGFDDYLPNWINSGISRWNLPYQEKQPDESNLLVLEEYPDYSVNFAPEPTHSESTFEDVQKLISNFPLSSIPASVSTGNPYLVPVNILYFHNGSHMLLPHGRGGRVYFVSRDNEIEGKITEASFDELSVGDVVVCFNMDRELVRKLAHEQLNEAYGYLDLWRSCLQDLLAINHGQLSGLERCLIQQKEMLGLSDSSPTRNNVLRWLYESDLLAPQTSNLKLILQASRLSISDAELMASKIRAAKSLIIKNSNDVSERIRDRIVAVLRTRHSLGDDIFLDVDNVPVAIQCGRITDKEVRKNLEVPYTFTKQFIRD